MPVHDWTLVDAGIFHDFHTVWIGQIRTALNSGLLPKGYYALAEQHAGKTIADVLTLHTSENDSHGRSGLLRIQTCATKNPGSLWRPGFLFNAGSDLLSR